MILFLKVVLFALELLIIVHADISSIFILRHNWVHGPGAG